MKIMFRSLQSWTLAGLLVASANAASLLAPRAPSCAAADGLQACPTGLDFCCPTGTTCVPTTSTNSTVVCCPSGKDCSAIQPITCDISQQNATLYPSNLLHSNDLSFQMPTCKGDSCCPAGFTCQDQLCILSSRLTPPTSLSGAASSSLATATSSPTAPVVIPSTSAAPGAPEAQPAQGSHTTPPGFIALAVLLSIAGATAILLALVWFLKRRKTQRRNQPPSPDFMGTTPRTPNNPEMQSSATTPAKSTPRTPPRPQHSAAPSVSSISQPILMDQFGINQRTDFLRRGDSQSGFERKNKPLWSKINNGSSVSSAALARSLSRKNTRKPDVERGRTRQVIDASIPDATSPSMTRPFTPLSQAGTAVPTSASSTPRRKSLFVKPLRLPTINTNTAAATTSPSRAPPRTGTSAAGLAAATFSSQRTANPPRHASPHHASNRANGGRSLDSTSSIDSDTDHDTKEFARRDASTETINVLMQPPSLHSSQTTEDPHRRQTRFSDLIAQASFKSPGSRT